MGYLNSAKDAVMTILQYRKDFEVSDVYEKMKSHDAAILGKITDEIE